MNTIETLTAPITWDATASRSNSGGATLVGHAAVFDRRSQDLGGFVEELAPGAFKRALDDPQTDAMLLAEHGGLPLARQSAGTLNLSEDGTGLRVEATLAPTTAARDIQALVESKHLTQMSFAFTCAADEWSRAEGSPLRRVTEVGRLFEVSVVGTPAYPQTSIAARSGVRVTAERGHYGADSEHSYFKDLLRVAEADQRRRAAQLDPVLRGRDMGEPGGVAGRRRQDGSLEDARKRLASAEGRALTTTSASPLVPENVPDSLASEFATAARNVSVMPGIIGEVEPLPADTGMTLKVPKIKTGKGASVTVDGENETVSETLPETAQVEVPIAYVSGEVKLSRQLLDRARPDNAIAQELGAALGERVEHQILAGSGEGEEALGLLNIEGISSTTWTSETPTGPEMVKKIGANYAAVATALGYAPDLVLATPARRAWLLAQTDKQEQPLTPRLPASLSEVPGLALGLGGGENQDAILTLATPEVDVYMNPPQVKVMADFDGSNTLTAKVIAWTSLAVLVVREQGVGKITGSGLVTPSFT